jgi:hypothetical protein
MLILHFLVMYGHGMKPRLIGVLTILALSISATAMPVSAAVKAGAKCKVVGQIKAKKSKEFTCIAKGKKLVWSKAKTTKKIVPQVTPTPTPVQTSFSFKFNLDKSLPEDWTIEFKKIMNTLQDILPINPNINNYVRNSVMEIYSWSSAVANPFTEKPNMSGASISGDSPTNRWMVLEINRDEFKNDNSHRYSAIVHEYFHVYQIALSKDSMSPKWLVEGGAKVLEEIFVEQYYGKSNLEGDLKFQKLWSDDVFANPSLFEKYETSSSGDMQRGWMDMNYAGSAYMVLTLVKELQKDNVPEQKALEMVFRDFWVEKSTQRDWKLAFEKVFKMSVETFYARLGKFSRTDIDSILPSKPLKIQEIFITK